MSYSVIVVGAGSGTRFSTQENKLLYQLKDKTPVIKKTLSVFLNDADCFEVVLVASDQLVNHFREGMSFPAKMVITTGGMSRQESVYNGLLAVAGDYVLIHDGARPWINIEDVKAVVKALEKEKAVCLTAKITDTVKVVEGKHIVNTLNREELRAAQTPQGFHLKELVKCYKDAIKAGIVCTDDSQLYQLMSGKEVYYLDAKYPNQKITTLEDVKGK